MWTGRRTGADRVAQLPPGGSAAALVTGFDLQSAVQGLLW